MSSAHGAETKQAKKDLIQKFRTHESDSGSPEVQIALMTDRLTKLADHFKTNPKDVHSQRGMLRIISQRKQMLQYLKDENAERYKTLISALGLRK